ncbi:MAG: glycosyltransferase family 39 protein [Candidatus Omnitrophica bacterium]|nr:glycosyltransferase family 39 protein [Candidatus Omnitrophota bacterium]
MTRGTGIIMLGLCAVVCIQQYIWLKLDHSPPWGDAMHPIFRGLYLLDLIKSGKIGGLIKACYVLDLKWIYPPTVAIAYCAYYLLFGINEMALMVNALYLCLGVWGVLGIGKELFGERTGVLAAVVFASLPGVLFAEKLGFREFHAMCILAVVGHCLLKTRYFSDRYYSFLTGFIFAFAMMTRIESIIYLLPPSLFLAYKGLRKGRSPTMISNIMIMVMTTIVIMMPWLVLNHKVLIHYYFYKRIDPTDIYRIWVSLENMMYYSKHLYKILLGPVFLFVFLASVVVSCMVYFTEKERSKSLIMICLFLCFFVPWVFFHAVSIKDFSHIFPLFIIIALLIVGVNQCIGQKSIRGLYVAFILFFCMRSIAFPITRAYELNELELPPYFKPALLFLPWDKYADASRQGKPEATFQGVVTRAAWDDVLKTMINSINDDHAQETRMMPNDALPSVLLLQNYFPLRHIQLNYYNALSGASLKIANILEGEGEPDVEIQQQKYDYIVIERPYLFISDHPESRYINEFNAYILKNENVFNDHYEKISEIDLPRGTQAFIYSLRR